VLTRAVLVLSHAAAKSMVGRGSGAVVNVSSVAGWLASGTYSAAKSWVTVFTEGLSTELAGTGVTATALCPGFTRTEFQLRAGIGTPGPRFLWLDATRLVRDCLDDVDRGRVVSVPGAQYKAIAALLHVAPRTLLRRRLRPPTRRGCRRPVAPQRCRPTPPCCRGAEPAAEVCRPADPTLRLTDPRPAVAPPARPATAHGIPSGRERRDP
jgi:NAD(P)-dependent dehydrogenase (short-subunit alcohol dehydrogenase family)